MSQNNGYSLSVDTDICSAIVVVFLLLLLLFLYHSVEENLVLNDKPRFLVLSSRLIQN